MRLLADTSAWIAYLRGGRHPVTPVLKEALAREEVVLAPPIVAELLVGARDETERGRLERLLGALPHLEITRRTGMEAGRIGFRLARHGLTVPAVDLLVAATCILEDCELLHLDRHFTSIARHAPLKIVHT